MDAFLATHWEPRLAPVADCIFFETSATSSSSPPRFRVHLTTVGIELQALSDAARSSRPRALFRRTLGKRDPLVLLPWADVLGATPLDSEEDGDGENVRQFVIHACVAHHGKLRHRAVAHDKTRTSTSVASSARAPTEVEDKPMTSTSTTTSTPTSTVTAMDTETATATESAATATATEVAPVASAAVDRTLVKWVFRCHVPETAQRVPLLLELIQMLADPRALVNKMDTIATTPLPQRKFLIFVNPASGSGRAKNMYTSTVAPLFQSAGIDCDVIVTERQAQATDHVRAMPLNVYDCVVAVGGDGLLSEIYMGLMSRPDWKEAVRQPLGVLPGGSGNGLAVSLLTRSREKVQAVNAAYALVKGTAQELDLATIRNADQQVMYSFLSLEWALAADVDIESERFRMFGGLRFTISAVAKILGRRSPYMGTLRYLSSENDTSAPLKYFEQDHGDNDTLAPATALLDAYADHQPANDGEWKEMSGEFHLFWGMSVTHAASDSFVAPGARPDDGYYHIVCVQAPFSRFEVAKMLIGLDNGTHFENPRVLLIRTRAFTLDLDNANDRICVDGELFKGPKLQVEVHRALARVITLPPLGS